MEIMQLIGSIADVGGAIAAVVSTVGLAVSLKTRRDMAREHARQNAMIKIRIVLAQGGNVRTHDLPIVIRRKDVERAEIQGRIANALLDTSKRYSLRYLAHNEYQRQIYAVQDGVQDMITIPCTAQEFAQFMGSTAEVSIAEN